MRILILGGCGYIGSALYSHLKNAGRYQITTVDLEWFGNYVNPDNLCVDFRHLSANGPPLSTADVVILLAGHSSVPMCKNDMMSSFKNNVANFVDLLNKIKEQKFIYASSSSIYGNTQDISAPENWERYNPATYYDLNKQEIDYYAKLSRVEYYGLRFGTVNGFSPNQRVDIMLNKMYDNALASREIEIYNKHIFRPILGIQDLCRAMEAIIRGGNHPGIYNLASFNASVEDIANAISETLKDVKIIDKGVMPAYNFSINTTKFQDTYNFDFRESVRSIVQSLKEHWGEAHKSVREGKKYE